jgi:hypothetical protein
MPALLGVATRNRCATDTLIRRIVKFYGGFSGVAVVHAFLR